MPWQSFFHAPLFIHSDRELVMAAVKQKEMALLSPLNDFKGLRFRLRCGQRQLVLVYASFSADRGTCTLSSRREQNGFALKYADEVLRRDRGVVIEALKEYGFALQSVDDSLRADHNVVMAIVRQSSRALALSRLQAC